MSILFSAPILVVFPDTTHIIVNIGDEVQATCKLNEELQLEAEQSVKWLDQGGNMIPSIQEGKKKNDQFHLLNFTLSLIINNMSIASLLFGVN